MKTLGIHSYLVLAASLAVLTVSPARADESTSHIAFSNPAKPGTLKIRVSQGNVTVHGGDVKEVTVKTESTTEESQPREDGMRVLSASSNYRLSEHDNVVTLEYGADGWTGTAADFDITVPQQTSVTVGSSIRGDLECFGLSGDLDIRTLNGDVKGHDLSGGVSVETMNGEITVGMKTLNPSKPLSLTSMNGKVTILVPGSTKAAVRFRTHHGVILTNFDDKSLVTRTEVSRRDSRREYTGHAQPVPPVAPVAASPADKPEKPEKPESKEMASDDSGDHAPSAESDGDWHNEVRDSIREAADEAAMAAREAHMAISEGFAQIHVQMGRIPPLPPMTGGKVVAGTLNGGGGEIQAATLNGDIVFKKID